jgi:N-acetylneuraminic acid mutarotase
MNDRRHSLRSVALGIAGLLAAVVAGCGGGGGSDSTGTAPTLSNLSYSPNAAYVSSAETTFSGQVVFSDPDGDLASATLTVLDARGAPVSTTSIPIQGAGGLTTGTLSGSVTAALPAAGSYTLRVTVTDARGLVSNALVGTIRIADFPWTSRRPAPTTRQHAAAAVIDGRLYLVGGQLTGTGVTPGPATGVLEIYDPATDTWTTGASMPTPRMGLVAATVGGKLYAIGGATDGFQSPNATGTVEVYDPATNTWAAGVPMPTARAYAGGAAVEGGRVIVAGGRTQATDVLGVVESYDPATQAWSTLPSLPTARRDLAATSIGGTLYAAGGYGGVISQWVGAFEAFDGGAWTTRGAMPTARSNLALAATDGKVFAAGGENVERTLDLLEVYDPATGTWSTKTPSPTPFTRSVGAVIDGRIYIVGDGLTLRYDPANEIR